MMTFEEYTTLYPDGPGEGDFPRLAWQAQRVLDEAVTGVDGVNKLTAAPPVEERAQEAVRRCLGALVHELWRTEQGQAVAVRADGAVTGRVVTAVTAGAESVTYAAPNVAMGETGRNEALARTVREHLGGVTDGNGVLLLYTGRYPMRVEA